MKTINLHIISSNFCDAAYNTTYNLQKGFRKMKILIAENNSAARMHHRERLISWGYDFDLAANGKETVDYVRMNRGSYDLCLMNVSLPAMDGINAIQEIRRESGYLPVIACSTNSDYKVCCLEAGADDFLVKPFASPLRA